MAKGGTFKKDVKKFADQFGIDVNLVLEKVAIDTFVDIVNQTPRDTARAAASWNLTINTPDFSYKEKKAKGTKHKLNAYEGIKYQDSQIKKSTIFFIANGLPYIQSLARGSSEQQPNGWIERILKNRVRYLKKAVNDVTGN